MRANVVVTFLRMDQPPTDPSPPLPEGLTVQTLAFCSVAQYRRLYNTVGQPYLWWLRRLMPDRELQALLDKPAVSIHVLKLNGVEQGFYELDASYWPAINLSYFGLMPHAVGQGFGYAFLRQAIDAGFAMGARAMTVNTCNADHPRALPSYQRAGFRLVRQAAEVWDVPHSLGLSLPAHFVQGG